jgi:hypothetical protein
MGLIRGIFNHCIEIGTLAGSNRSFLQTGPLEVSGETRAPESHFSGVLHTHRTLWIVQVHPKEEAPSCGAFAEPSDGLEPSTPLLTMDVVFPQAFESA